MFKFIVGFAFIGMVLANTQEEFAKASASASSDQNNNGFFSGNGWPQWPHFDLQSIKFPEIKIPVIDFSNVQWTKIPIMTAKDIANLKPEDENSHVSGLATSTNSKTVWKDGKPVTVAEAEFVRNDNGKVTSGKIPIVNEDSNSNSEN